jgi:hypothetical protein
VGYYPQWVNNTRDYLDDPANADVNVIVWSWCGQVDEKYAAGTLESEYLTPMAQLEVDYPDVTFVYMTGHVDIWDDADNKAANQVIRDYCTANGKILYDFADIERYDPDGVYYEYVHDNCNYYDAETTLLGNWATNWQNRHEEGVDWYDCASAHSEPLNANRKAYAAWWLWARLAGWTPNGADGDSDGTDGSDDTDGSDGTDGSDDTDGSDGTGGSDDDGASDDEGKGDQGNDGDSSQSATGSGGSDGGCFVGLAQDSGRGDCGD